MINRSVRCRVTAGIVACVVAAMMLLAPLGAGAQVLQQVPGDALVVIKVNKLKPVSDKLAALSKKLGLDQAQPAMADPLGALQKQSGLQQGIDPNGEMAVVFVNGAMNEQQPPVLLLIPVTDYDAFLKNFAGVKTEDQLSIVRIKDQGKEHFVMKRGNYAAMAQKREYLNMKADGLTPAASAGKELTGKDIVAYVNMKSARTRILPELKKNRAKILADFERNFKQGGQQPPGRRAPQPGAVDEEGAAGAGAGAGAGAKPKAAAAANAEREKYLPLARAVINRGLDVAEQLITDADAATYGWSFGDAGVSATGLVEFTANSPSGQRVAQLKNSADPLTKGLPAGKYWFFGGTSGNNTELGQKLINEFLAPIDKEFAALGAPGKAIQDYLNAVRQYASSMRGQSFGWVAPQGAIGQEAIVQMVSVQRGDAPKMLDATKKMFEAQQVVMQMVGGPAAMQGNVKQSYTPKAKTIDGVTLDLMQTTFAPPAGAQRTPQMMQQQQMMTWMYGPGGVNAYAGAVGNDKLVGAAGVNDEVLKQLVASAKADQDVLGTQQPVTVTTAQLPKQRLAAWYIQIDQFATSIANIAKQFGMPINFQVPQNLSPLGGTLSSEGSTVRVDGYAPTQTLQSVIAAGMQAWMQMQGGQQPGGPGGL